MGRYFKKKVFKKRSKVPYIIIGAIIGLIILIAIIYGIVKLVKKSLKPEYEVKTDLTMEINDKQPEVKDLFKVYKNMKDNMVKVNLNDLDVTKLGTYNIFVTVNTEGEDDDYVILATVVDTIGPTLKLKEVTIIENEETYKLDDFIESCSDNSNDFTYNYTDDLMALFRKAGTYTIKIRAIDVNHNETIEETKLIIKTKDEEPIPEPEPEPEPEPTPEPTPEPEPEPEPEPQPEPTPEPEPEPTCAYGSLEISGNSKYPIAYYVAQNNNNCPLDAEKYDLSQYAPNSVHVQELNKIANKDLELLWTQTNTYIIKNAELLYERVLNKEKTGIVGYRMHVIEYVDESGSLTTETVKGKEEYIKENYYLNSDGSRYYIVNQYNLK